MQSALTIVCNGLTERIALAVGYFGITHVGLILSYIKSWHNLAKLAKGSIPET